MSPNKLNSSGMSWVHRGNSWVGCKSADKVPKHSTCSKYRTNSNVTQCAALFTHRRTSSRPVVAKPLLQSHFSLQSILSKQQLSILQLPLRHQETLTISVLRGKAIWIPGRIKLIRAQWHSKANWEIPCKNFQRRHPSEKIWGKLPSVVMGVC